MKRIVCDEPAGKPAGSIWYGLFCFGLLVFVRFARSINISLKDESFGFPRHGRSARPAMDFQTPIGLTRFQDFPVQCSGFPDSVSAYFKRSAGLSHAISTPFAPCIFGVAGLSPFWHLTFSVRCRFDAAVEIGQPRHTCRHPVRSLPSVRIRTGFSGSSKLLCRISMASGYPEMVLFLLVVSGYWF